MDNIMHVITVIDIYVEIVTIHMVDMLHRFSVVLFETSTVVIRFNDFNDRFNDTTS